MAFCTLVVGEYPEIEAQFIRDQLEAGRYVYIDHPDVPFTKRVINAKRVKKTVRVRSIDGLWIKLIPGVSIIRIEKA